MNGIQNLKYISDLILDRYEYIRFDLILTVDRIVGTGSFFLIYVCWTVLH